MRPSRFWPFLPRGILSGVVDARHAQRGRPRMRRRRREYTSERPGRATRQVARCPPQSGPARRSSRGPRDRADESRSSSRRNVHARPRVTHLDHDHRHCQGPPHPTVCSRPVRPRASRRPGRGAARHRRRPRRQPRRLSESRPDQGVLPGVSVGGVDLAGLDRDAAQARLAAELPVGVDRDRARGGRRQHSTRSPTPSSAADTTSTPCSTRPCSSAGEMDRSATASSGCGRSSSRPPFPSSSTSTTTRRSPAAAHRIAAVVTTYPREATVTRDGQRPDRPPFARGTPSPRSRCRGGHGRCARHDRPLGRSRRAAGHRAATGRRHRSRHRSGRCGARDDPGPRAHHPRRR